MKITVSKDCETCPIKSPFGTLTTDSTATMAVHGHTTYVWNKLEPSTATKGRCGHVLAYGGSGKLILSDKNDGKLRDDLRQLEYFVDQINITCPGLVSDKTFAIKGIPDAFITVKTKRSKRHSRVPSLKDSNLPVQLWNIKSLFSNKCLTLNKAYEAVLGGCDQMNPKGSPLVWEISNANTLNLREHLFLNALSRTYFLMGTFVQNEIHPRVDRPTLWSLNLYTKLFRLMPSYETTPSLCLSVEREVLTTAPCNILDNYMCRPVYLRFRQHFKDKHV